MKRILEFLDGREYELKYRWLGKHELGAIDPETQTIYLNLILLAAETFIHEYYHERYPELPEAEVEELTKRKIMRLKDSELKKLGKRLLDHQFCK